jgi:hypothetical protein
MCGKVYEWKVEGTDWTFMATEAEAEAIRRIQGDALIITKTEPCSWRKVGWADGIWEREVAK